MTKSENSQKLGQHWLNDEASLEAIVAAGEIKPSDEVLEIGPGQGSLTEVLLAKAGHIIAVEFDEYLIPALKIRFANNPQIDIIQQDIRTFNFSSLPSSYKIIANIPYYLTSLLVRQICETTNPPSVAVLLVQKEVAQRVCAGGGEMSILSVTTQMYYETLLGELVPAELFSPPPKVDSQVLILKRRAVPLFGEQNPKELFRLVKAGFSEKRKKLRSSLSGGLGISKIEAEALLAKAKIDSNLRAQNLSLQDWLRLASVKLVDSKF